MESLLLCRDDFRYSGNLTEMLKFIAKSDVAELGYIRNQNCFSNSKSAMMFHFNMNAGLLKQFDEFLFYYKFFEYNDYIFYGHPYCACNSPASIFIGQRVSMGYVFNEKKFLDWFENKEYNWGVFDERGLEWKRFMYSEEKDLPGIGENMFKQTHKKKQVLVDSEGNLYTPFNKCDSEIYESGCSSSIDVGYIKHKR